MAIAEMVAEHPSACPQECSAVQLRGVTDLFVEREVRLASLVPRDRDLQTGSI